MIERITCVKVYVTSKQSWIYPVPNLNKAEPIAEFRERETIRGLFSRMSSFADSARHGLPESNSTIHIVVDCSDSKLPGYLWIMMSGRYAYYVVLPGEHDTAMFRASRAVEYLLGIESVRTAIMRAAIE